MKVSHLVILAITATALAGCATQPPSPVLIPSETQVEQGTAPPAVIPAK
jgi:type IV pilus biogenesis protein CpaD/CtpE